MRPLLLALVASLSLLATTGAPAAAAAPIPCDYYEAYPGEEDGSPRVSDLKAYNLPRFTSDYAPPCLVAATLAGVAQFRAAEGKTQAKKITAMGARWYGGVYRCSYAGTRVSCRKSGKPRRRITFELRAA